MVSSFSSLLEHRYAAQLDDKARLLLNQVSDGSKRMQALVRDILTFSKSGQVQKLIAVDCNEVLEKALYNLQQILDESKAEISKEVLPTVQGDPVLLGQVIQNLLSNALKFRHKDRLPHIRIGARCDGTHWRFNVTDNGIGIPQQYHDKVFGVFQRLHSRDDYAGTGIGLAICRKAIQQLGGTITIDPTHTEGTSFHFTIPSTKELVSR